MAASFGELWAKVMAYDPLRKALRFPGRLFRELYQFPPQPLRQFRPLGFRENSQRETNQRRQIAR